MRRTPIPYSFPVFKPVPEHQSKEASPRLLVFFFRDVTASSISQYCGDKNSQRILNGRSTGQKVFFSSHSKADQREAGTAITVSPCVPIILCTLTSADLVVKRESPHVARENSERVCETADAPASFKSDMWKYFCFPV